MNIFLYKVNRNINRAYRICEAFGIQNLYLIDCGELTGNLFKAKDRVIIKRVSFFPEGNDVLALETNYKKPLWEIDFSKIKNILIGGESIGLPVTKLKIKYKAIIPMSGQISGLTVDASLAIALYQRSLFNVNKM